LIPSGVSSRRMQTSLLQFHRTNCVGMLSLLHHLTTTEVQVADPHIPPPVRPISTKSLPLPSCQFVRVHDKVPLTLNPPPQRTRVYPNLQLLKISLQGRTLLPCTSCPLLLPWRSTNMSCLNLHCGAPEYKENSQGAWNRRMSYMTLLSFSSLGIAPCYGLLNPCWHRVLGFRVHMYSVY